MKRFIFLAFLFVGQVSLAQELPQLRTPPVAREVLGNGAKLLLIQDRSLPLTRVQFIFNQGSALDPKGLEGLANVASEMLMRGTKTLSKEKLRRSFERIGASAGISAGPKETQVSVTCLTEALPEVLSLIQKILNEPAPQARELTLLKNEVIEGIRSLPDRTATLTQTAFKAFADPENPYWKPSHGKISTVQKISLQNVRTFAKAMIRGGNLTVAAVSNLDPNDLKTRLTDLVKGIPEGKTEEAVVPPLKPWTGTRILILDKKGQETMNMQIGHPTNLTASSPERVPLLVTNYMFGSAPLISALFKEVRSNRGWTYGIWSNYTFRSYRGPFSIYLFPTRKFGIDAFKLTLEMMHNYMSMGVPPSDLRYAKTALVNQSPFLFETAEDVLSRVLEEETGGTPKGYYENFPKAVMAVHDEKSTLARAIGHKEAQAIAAVVLGDANELEPELKKLPNIESVQVIKADDYLK